MSEDTRFRPKPFQVVSDLGQLTVFIDPQKTGVLRVLQQQEATCSEVAELVGLPDGMVAELIGGLCDLGLVKVVGQRDMDDSAEYVYRATAKVYHPRPDPGSAGVASASVSAATMLAAYLDSVSREVVSSLEKWPKQAGNYESRRARISDERMEEFNDRMVDLINEYWGGPDRPAEEDPEAPARAFVGFWYRSPTKP